ncbi:PEP-CTERM system TPR-repeat protein PrsT [Aestuariibacter sp. AA17]|uniref:PEP-CTERM system TPR-repeat protein PrsT n=1 Tax=Fluctibacter corallii TaxID=2984329 RepID=A0ABT3A3F7_9ALTE|nr:XrtA/PEP-CTERM system TPR-repeat protein PrsT [Aestuariibacter sp. AA17]MCV2883193.1 PEP-CTERM system TPR-repeat protein PrsT [Aestuariibacter sp. AA17]
MKSTNTYFKRLSLATTLLCSIVSFSALAQDSSEYYEKARIAFANDKLQEAYIHLKNSLKEDEDNLPAKILMGRVLLINGYMEEAETEFEEALAKGADPNLVAESLGKVWLFLQHQDKLLSTSMKGLTPTNQANWLKLRATAHYAKKQYEQAENEYEKALNLAPNDISILTAYASMRLSQNNLDAAETLLSKAYKINPKHGNTLRLLGELKNKQGDLSAAKRYLIEANDVLKDDPMVKRSLVSLYLKLEDQNSAQTVLEDILAQTPNDPFATLVNAWVQARKNEQQMASTELEKLSGQLASLPAEQIKNDPQMVYMSALTAFAQNNFEQANTFLNQYLTLQPENETAVNLLAETLRELGKYRQALDIMQRNESARMQELDSAILLGNLYLANDKTFKTMEIVDALKSRFPKNKDVELLEIKTLIARKKHEQAFRLILNSEHSKTDPNYVLTYSLLLMETGKVNEAIAVSDELIEIAPNSADFKNFKGALLIKMKRWDDALRYIEEALSISPNHFSATFNKANILAAKGEYDSARTLVTGLRERQPANKDVKQLTARLDIVEGNTDSATATLQTLLGQDFDNLAARELLVDAYVQANEYEKAHRQVNELIKLAPNRPEYSLKRAQLFILREQPERAERELAKTLEKASDNGELLFAINRMALRIRAYDIAEQSITNAVKSAPDNSIFEKQRVTTFIAAGQFKQASEALSGLMKKVGRTAELLTIAADIAQSEQHMERAVTLYTEALEKTSGYRPAIASLYQLTRQNLGVSQFEKLATRHISAQDGDLFTRNMLADFYMNQHAYDKALPHYEYLLTIDTLPHRAFILNNVANIFINSDVEKAFDYAKQALDTGTEAPSILDTYGWLLAQKGQYRDALDVLRRAFSMNANDPAIRYHLGYALSKLGRTSEAKSELQAAINTQQDFAERDDAKALLASLQ